MFYLYCLLLMIILTALSCNILGNFFRSDSVMEVFWVFCKELWPEHLLTSGLREQRLKIGQQWQQGENFFTGCSTTVTKIEQFRLRQHVSDPKNPPILIFPEGTCINNTRYFVSIILNWIPFVTIPFPVSCSSRREVLKWGA